MPSQRQQGYDGMANLAHSVRRSTALYVAMNMTPPEEGMDGLFARADQCAEWIKGHAEQSREEGLDPGDESGSLGQPWSEVTAQ